MESQPNKYNLIKIIQYIDENIKKVAEITTIIYRFISYKIRFFSKNIIIDPRTHVSISSNFKTPYGGSIRIGKYSEIHENVLIHTYGGDIRIGEFCSFNPNCVIYGHGGLRIGNYVRIATQTVIIPANHTFEDRNTPIYYQAETREGIRIDDDVWIGAGVKILDGVHIGKGCVVGAGSVVTKSLPDFSVAVGVPARIIYQRGEHRYAK